MKRILRILGLVMVVVSILAVGLAGTALAAESFGPNPLAGDGTPDGSELEAPNGPNGDCICDGSNCEPKLWSEPGPYGQRYGDLTVNGIQVKNRGDDCACEVCPCGDGVCDGTNCEPHSWGESEPYKQQKGK